LAQIFHERTNSLALYAAIGVPVAAILVVAAVTYYFSPRYTNAGYRPKQPVPYSHKLHAGELGIDCRYCHAFVEASAIAGVPPTQVCMNCHATVLRDSPKLEPIRASLASGMPMSWVRVHDLPDYAYFSHAAHLRAGVGCITCHGRIDQMEEVMQVEPLSMSWCLDCHRDPAPRLRPPDQVTNMRWSPPPGQIDLGRRLIEEKRLRPPVDCSGCHR
jgi:hypothetical protein